MMGISRQRLAAISCVALFVGLFAASDAYAQNAVITGKVTNEQGRSNCGRERWPSQYWHRHNGEFGRSVYSLTVPDDRASGQPAT